MKLLIVGFGNQGTKRAKFLKKSELFATYDPFSSNANYKKLEDIPNNKYNSVFLCLPDNQKHKMSEYFLKLGKNVFVEKPLFLKSKNINFLYNLAKNNKCIFYTAYNHRFEPYVIKIKRELQNYSSKIYHIKMFYGNGTARDVKNSKWRDNGLGVVSDLVPHLIDLLIFTLGFRNINKIQINKISRFENESPDHSIISFFYGNIYVDIEVSLCSWRNNFKFDIYSRKHSFHIDSLFKWGHSSYRRYDRVLPSGMPKVKNLINNNTSDPTWKLEHKYLSNRNFNLRHHEESLKRDLVINKCLEQISKIYSKK